MGTTIDHLSRDRQVRVRQEFSDARGIRHYAGEQAVIRNLHLDWAKQEIVIEWEREGKPETLVFALSAREGPRNGRMRDYFSDEVIEPPPPPVKRASRRTGVSAVVPSLDDRPVTDPDRHADAVRRIWALAAQRRFAEAEEQIQIILTPSDPFGGILQQVADGLVSAAVAHAQENDRTVYAWLSDRAIGLWYAWGAQATSGGEGSERADHIRAAEARLPEP